MRRNEIDELIKIYETNGVEKLVERLYLIQQYHKDIELSNLLELYLHATTRNNNSCFYTSDKEQVVTNNSGSIIYFNKKLFDFKNINDRKIVVKESFKVNEQEMFEMLGFFRELCGKEVTSTNDIDFVDDKVVVTTKHNSSEFNKQEFEIIAKLLNYPSFNLSDNASVIHMQGANGYAYIKGYKTR